MNIAMGEMADVRLHCSARCKWAHCLAQTVAALQSNKNLRVLEPDSGLKDERLTDEFLRGLMAMGDAAPKKLVRSPVW